MPNFIMTEAVLITIVLILAIKMNNKIGTFSQIRHFWNMQLTFVVALITEIIWTYHNMQTIRLTVGQAWLLNGIALSSFSALLYEWFRFIAHRVLQLEKDRLALRAIIIQNVCAFVDILITASSFHTGWVYQIDAQVVYSRGPYYWVHTVLCYSHWVWTTILIVHYLRKRGLKERRQLNKMFWVSIVPCIGGLLQLINSELPFLDSTIMLSTLLIFINLQEEQITTDALTGLSNRADFEKMYERMLGNADQQPFVMLVADIDKFKQINDRYGHLEGDQALLLVANGLRKISSLCPSLYVCRYGGDEFVMLGLMKHIRWPEKFADSLNEMLRRETKDASLQCKVAFSTGYRVIDRKDIPLKEAFEQADQMLYAVKKNKH